MDRRERLRRLALETIDLSKDPYFMKNHLGQFECKLCLTLHVNEASYLSHTQGKKHQVNLGRRAAKEKMDVAVQPQPKAVSKKKTVKIGLPGYRVTKLRDPDTLQKALLFEIDYPEAEGLPRHRFMSAYEQKVDSPPDSRYQYLLFAAEPYETVAFKIPSLEVDSSGGKLYFKWDEKKKTYVMQVFFKQRAEKILPALPQRPTTFLPIGTTW